MERIPTVLLSPGIVHLRVDGSCIYLSIRIQGNSSLILFIPAKYHKIIARKKKVTVVFPYIRLEEKILSQPHR